MEVKDRFVLTEGDFIKERDVQSELALHELAMTQTHGDDEITALDQLLCQCSGSMCGWIGAFKAQPVEDDGMDLLRLSFDTRRFDMIGGWFLLLGPQRIFSGHASEDIAGTYKEN